MDLYCYYWFSTVLFDFFDIVFRYNTGDHVGIYVRNCSSNIERLQNQLGLAGNDALTNHPHDDLSQKPPLPTHCSVREALAKFLDVNGPVNICLLSQIFNSKAGSNDIYSQPNFHQYNGIAFQDKVCQRKYLKNVSNI
ncbi:hypothetical protein GJ496_004570 [Pomphorhynchus laevis]|nr:hypothetical protein GJ496_004570 [Pomphorhynchus laevis]